MANTNDAYQTIAEMWTFPNSASFRKMLEAMMSLENAELLVQCREPATLAELAKRLKTDEKSLSAKLDNLYKRGLLFKGQTQYQFRRGLHVGFAGMPAPGYGYSDEYRHWRKIWLGENPDREVKGWMERFRQTGHAVHRVYPARLAILSNPNIKKSDLLCGDIVNDYPGFQHN
jgi:hypothetical protein